MKEVAKDAFFLAVSSIVFVFSLMAIAEPILIGTFLCVFIALISLVCIIGGIASAFKRLKDKN